MKHKSIIILALTIFVLITIAGVSAADANNTAIASEDTGEIELSASDDLNATDSLAIDDSSQDTIVSGGFTGNFGELQNIIDDADEYDIIYLQKDYKGSGEISIDKNLYIDGLGHSINAQGKSRIFDISSDVLLENITFLNGNGGNTNGGAIYSTSYLELYRCSFAYNVADMGGAVSSDDYTLVEDCLFYENHALTGGGAIYSYHLFVGKNSKFINNTADEYGGSIYGYDLEVLDSSFLSYDEMEFIDFYNNEKEDLKLYLKNNTMYGVNSYYIWHESPDPITSPVTLTFNTQTVQKGQEIEIATFEDDMGNSIRTDDLIEVQITDKNSKVVDEFNLTFSDGYKYTCNLNDGVYTVNAVVSSSVATDVKVKKGTLTVSSQSEDYNYTQLKDQFRFDGDITLTAGNYTYVSGDGDTIEITTSKVIDGNGAVIDMANSGHRAFYITASDVTIKNLTIKNANYNGFGGAIEFSISGSVENCNFTDNKATNSGGAVYFHSSGNVTNCNFTNNSAQHGGAIRFNGECNVTNCNFTNNSAQYGGAVYFYSRSNVTNCNFTGNKATGDGSVGGAIYMNSGSVENCNFTGNKATGDDSWGGAIYMYSGSVENCNFTSNTATNGDGGAVYFLSNGEVTNCNFTGNNATTGSAIYFYSTLTTKIVSNSIFLNNRANAEALKVTKNKNNITLTFTGNDNLLNAIYSNGDVTFTNVTYWGANVIANTGNSAIKPSRSNKEAGQNITVGIVVDDVLVLSDVKVTDGNGTIVLDIKAGENYYIGVRHNTDSYYTEKETIISNNTKFNVNVTSQTTNNKTVNITAKSNILNEVIDGKLLFIVPNNEINATYAADGIWWAEHTFDDYADYRINASYIGLSKVNINNAVISITKANSTVNVSDVVLYYGETKNVTVTAEGATGITAKINTTNVTVVNNYTIPISGLAAGNYTLTVTTIPDEDHNPVTKTVNITVNKALTEIILTNETMNLEVNDAVPLGATLTPADAGNVTYAVSNSSVVKVDDGNVIALAEGEATITVSFAGDKKYAAAGNKTIKVNVSLKDASISVNNSTLELFVGDNFTVVATTDPLGLDVSFVPDDSGVYSVDDDGKVIALREGTGNILVKVGGDGVFAENSTEIAVSVSKVSTEIKILSPTGEMSAGAMGYVAAELIPSEAGNLTYASNDTNVVNVSPTGVIKAVNAGTALITVSFAGDDKYASAENKTITITVNLNDASVSVNNSTLDLIIDDEFTLVCETVPEGLNVTFTSTNSSVVAVDASGNVKAIGAGSATIVVSVGDGKVYAINTTDVAVFVSKKPTEIKVMNPSAEIYVNSMVTAGAQLVPCEAGNLTYSSSDSRVVNVSSTGIVKANNVGTAIITVSFAGDDEYAAAESKTITFTVFSPTEITLENTTFDLKVNDEVPAGATLTPADAGNLTYTSSNESVVIVEKGIIKALGEGTADVTVSFAGNGYYVAAENVTIAVSVTLNPASVSVNNSTLELKVDDNFTIVATTDPANLDVTFVPDNSGVVSVDDKGVVTALKEGTAVIIVKVGDGKVYAENSTEVTVAVSKIATEIALANETVELKAHKSIGDLAALSPAEAGNLTYTSSDEGIVLVSEDGTIYARIKGTATVTVSFAGNDKYAEAENRTITVTVTLNDASVITENDTIDLNVDDTCIINATADPSFLAVHYASSNESVATVTDYGNVKAVGEGTAIITLTVGNGETYAVNSTYVTVNVSKVPTEILIANETLDLKVNDKLDSGVSLNPCEAGNLTYIIGNSSIVKLLDNQIIALSEGSTTITFSFVGNDRYGEAENKSIAVTVTLNDAGISVNNSTLNLFVDDTFTIAAVTVPESLDVTFIPDNSGVVSVDENGLVTALKEGTGTIIVKVGGDGVYAENSTEITVTVSKIPTEIIIDSASLELFVGDETVIAASLTPAGAGNVTFTSSNDAVVSIDGQGNVVACEKGQVVITVSFAGDNKYAAAENKTITVDVRLNDASVTVDSDTLDLKFDETYAINATKHPDTILLDITYTSSNSSIATVDEKGIVTAVGEGTAVITVEVGDDEIYAKNSTSVTVTVSKIPTEITIASATVDMEVNDEVSAGAALTPADAGNLTFTSSNNNVVAVDGEGNVKAIGAGKANITVSFAGNDKYAAAENKTISVTVSLKDSSVSADDIELKVGANATIEAVTSPEGLEITYVLDNSGVVTVENGVITAVKKGIATITLKVGGDGIYAENSTAITVTVKKQDADVNVSMPENVTVGDNSTVNAVLPEDAMGDVTVKVDGEVIGTVPVSNGIASVELPGLSAGGHTVEIAYSGDGKYNPLNETKEITVSKKDTTPEITIPSDIAVGDNATVDITLPSDASGNVTLEVDGEVIGTVPVSNGIASVELPDLSAGNHTVEIAYSGDDKYSPATQTKEIRISKKDTTPEIAVNDSSVNVKLPNDATGNVTVKVDDAVVSTVPLTDGTASVRLPKLKAGNHTVEIAYSGDDKYNPSTKTTTVSGDMDSTKLTANDVDATYKVEKYLTITLTDSSGNPIANAKISVNLKSLENYTTDANGQIKVKISNLPPNTYTAKITFKGDDNYIESNTTAKVTVKKANPKMTAKTKTFKTTTKNKKYTITLKDNNGKAIKKATVYLKVAGKTYKAVTNSKGKATFNLKKLSKKGKYNAVITYKGSNCYSKVTKKVKITVKTAFKTIARGSKLKNTVKKIQRALKHNGYYLTAYGHYLMVDGIYHIHTENAVKQFQKAKGLKVTGKVDEKTAKKLKII